MDRNPSGVSDVPREAHELFAHHWTIYRKVIDGNYMFHREIFAEVRQRLARSPGPLRLLDLGCGDAGEIAAVLIPLQISGYVGVDLSETALQRAARHLMPIGSAVELHAAEMLDWLRRDPTRYGAIVSSFALHHLRTEQKQDVLRLCRDRLEPGGQMLLVDVMRGEGQTIAAFLDDYCDHMACDWHDLDRKELAYVIDHVRGNDMPEAVSDFRRMASVAGFAQVHLIIQRTFHHLLCLETTA